MKMNLWLLCGIMVSTAVMAEQATNSPASGPIETPAPAPPATTPVQPATPPPTAPTPAPETPAVQTGTAATNAPAKTAKKGGKKKTGEKKAAEKKGGKKKGGKEGGAKTVQHHPRILRAETKTVPLVAGPAVVTANHVNLRGQAKLHSEVIGHLTKGEQVTVIEEITLNNSAPDEPSAWAKIGLPSTAHTWVNSNFIDPATKTVKARRLNLRAGPGENYSVLGRIDRGETVKEVGTKGDWTEIEPPAHAYAFVAAQFLNQEGAAAAPPQALAVAANTTPPPTPTTEVPPVTAAPETNPPALTPTASETNPPVVATEPPSAPPAAQPAKPAPAEPPIQEPPPPRIIAHEGIVRGMTSIQAPSYFALISPDNGKIIDYLYTTSKELDLRRFKGLRVIATGEEGLDERWGHTPVLTIQEIKAITEPPPFAEPPPPSAPK